jgi:hypothetical protein
MCSAGRPACLTEEDKYQALCFKLIAPRDTGGKDFPELWALIITFDITKYHDSTLKKIQKTLLRNFGPGTYKLLQLKHDQIIIEPLKTEEKKEDDPK